MDAKKPTIKQSDQQLLERLNEHPELKQRPSPVDEFLLGAGLEPVKQSCWLWRKRDPLGEVDYWIGDARADNFVKTATGMVPIDLRMWTVVLTGESAAGA